MHHLQLQIYLGQLLQMMNFWAQTIFSCQMAAAAFCALHYIQICLQAQGSREAKVSQMDLACPRGQDQLGKTPSREGMEAWH